MTELRVIKGDGGQKPPRERKQWTARDELRERFYSLFALNLYVPEFVRVWACRKLARLHAKYDFPAEEDSVEIPTYPEKKK